MPLQRKLLLELLLSAVAPLALAYSAIAAGAVAAKLAAEAVMVLLQLLAEI